MAFAAASAPAGLDPVAALTNNTVMPVALVTGASRGVGRGAAAALAQQGFTVYATGRTIASAALPPEVVRMPCDHCIDDQTRAVFERIASEAGPPVLS